MSYSTPLWTSNNSAPGCLVPRDYDSPKNNLDSGSAIPLLWSACFSSKDITVVIAPEEDWSADDCPHYLASWDSDLNGAVSRLERRLPSVLKIVPEHTHDICRLFHQRLANSTATHIHLDLGWLLDNDENPENGRWEKSFGKMLDGLDEPVADIRDGFLSKILGLGLPSSWNDACFWAMSAQSAKLIREPDVELYYIAGAGSVEEIQSWNA
ncbi:MAG: hypothetical protein ACREO1_02750 [Arenimonas sp.]